MTSTFDFDFNLGLLAGLAAAANPEIARETAERIDDAHDAEIAALTAEIATLRAQLADMPTPDDMRVLALGFIDLGALGYDGWGRYDAIKAAVIARWAPKPEPEPIPTDPTTDTEF